jgi:guanylate kinase
MNREFRKKKFPIVISAPSGSGKTTIIQDLLSRGDDYVFAVSTTTRKRRQNEEEGKSYYYVPVDEFKKKIKNNEFLEWAIVHQNYYGTTQKEVDRLNITGKIPIFDIDVQGVKQVKGRILGAVYIFIIPSSIDVLKQRLINRASDNPEQIGIRINNAIKELKEYRDFDYVILNESVEKAVDDLSSIIRAEKCRRHRYDKEIELMMKESSDDTP